MGAADVERVAFSPADLFPVGDFHVGIAGDRRHAAVPEAVDGYVRFGVVAAVLPGGEVAVFGDAVAHPAVVGSCVGLGGKAAVGLTEEPVFVFLVGDIDKRGEHAEREADYGAVGVGSRRRCRVGGGMVEGGCRQDERGAYPHAEVAKFCIKR